MITTCVIYALLNNAPSDSRIASDGRKIIRKAVEERNCSLIWGAILALHKNIQSGQTVLGKKFDLRIT